MRTENLRDKLLLHQSQQSRPHGALGSQNQRKQARVLSPPPGWRNSLNLMPNRPGNLPLRRPAHTPRAPRGKTKPPKRVKILKVNQRSLRRKNQIRSKIVHRKTKARKRKESKDL